MRDGDRRMARAGGGAGPGARGCRDPRRERGPTPSCWTRRATGAARLRALGAGPGRPRRDRAARRASSSRRRCTPACCWARRSSPSTCASRRPSASGSPQEPRCSSRSRSPLTAKRSDPALRHDLDATALVVHTSGTTAAPEAGRADLRQPAVERARLRRSRSAATPGSAGCARCRSRTSAASRS